MPPTGVARAVICKGVAPIIKVLGELGLKLRLFWAERNVEKRHPPKRKQKQNHEKIPEVIRINKYPYPKRSK